MTLRRDSAQGAVGDYVTECARIVGSGHATDERSYYTALNNLLTRLGKTADPPRTTIPEPAAREGNFPDLGLYEEHSQVLVLPVEVKPATVTIDDLAARNQPAAYARSFGGGRVLLTNLHMFAWAELDPATGQLDVRDTVAVTDAPDAFTRSEPPVQPDAGRRLAEMLDAACAQRATITDADRVAQLLAYHACRALDAVNAAGEPQELLRPLADSMRQGLGMELEDEFFAPTIVQTLVYSIFAAWLDAADPAQLRWRETGYQLRSIPVVGDLFYQISQPDFIHRCNLSSPLDAAANVLRWVDRDAFNAAFDTAAIEYFYEPFLARFDPDLRDRLGVWYTPTEIAEYQVRRADHHLRVDLGLTDGLADEEVIVLDPAVGTATYLRAVLDAIYEHHLDNGEPPAIAADHTRRAALNRIVGFEVLPAAFVIAHLHLNRHLVRLGAPLGADERLRIYLTNSLTGWGSGKVPPMPLPGLEKELAASLAVKHTEPVLVVLGNPPYEGYSAADSDEERELLNDWIEPLWSEYGLRKHRLGDLYVRFWRIAVRKIAELSGRGVITYITNRKWLGGRSFPVMRERILHSFDAVIIDDLHGDVHDTTHPGDGSIFTTETAAGIQRGVAIATLVRSNPSDNSRTAEVRGRDFRGSGAEKRAQLAAHTTVNIDEGLDTRLISRKTRWKLTASTAGDDPALDEYFDFYLSGVQPLREEAVADADWDRLAGRMREYFDPTVTTDDLIARHPAFGMERSGFDSRLTREQLMREAAFDATRMVPFLYRPFDVRWLYWETRRNLLHRPRRELFPYYINQPAGMRVDDQYAIVASQTPRRPGASRPALTSAVPGMESVDPNARVLPRVRPTNAPLNGSDLQLPFDQEPERDEWRTNVREDWLTAAREAGIDGDNLTVGDAVFYGLIAIMYAPSWASAIGTEHDDFAPVPLPADHDTLQRAADLGGRLAALSDPLTPVPGVTMGRLDLRYAPLATPDHTASVALTTGTRNAGGRWIPNDDDYETGTVLWDDQHGWRNVPHRAWQFTVGGFPVLTKWLGYRHQRRDTRLTADDIIDFTYLVRRVTAILDLTDACEDIYQSALDRTLEPPVSG